MWKHPRTPNRRRFAFDLLEDRELLNGGYGPFVQADVVEIRFGPSADPAMMGGQGAQPSGRESPMETFDPDAWDSAAWMGGRYDSGFRGPMDGPDEPIAGQPWVTAGYQQQTAPPPPGPMTDTNAVPASNASTPGAGVLGSGALPSSPSGGSGGGNLTGGGASGMVAPGFVGGSSPPSSSPAGMPMVEASVGEPLFGRAVFVTTPAFFVMDPANSPVLSLAVAHGRSDPFEPGGPTGAPSNSAAGLGGPGAQAFSPLAPSVSAATVVPTTGIQAVSSASAPPAQAAAFGDPGPIHVDHPAMAIATVQAAGLRGAVEAGRPTLSLGRSVLATTLSHSVLLPGAGLLESDPALDAVELTPRGADLIAEALPFAGDSLERGLDEFVRQLESVDFASQVAGGPSPTAMVAVSVLTAFASALAMREFSRRRSGRRRGARMVDHLGRELALSLPELPRSWPERRR